MVRWLAGLQVATAARVHSIDRRGITLYAEMPGDGPVATARVAFVEGPLNTADDIRPAVVALTHRARQLAEAAT